MAPARKGKAKEEQAVVSLGPQAREGELIFGVAHIYASFNDTFVHVTDISGTGFNYIFSIHSLNVSGDCFESKVVATYNVAAV